MKSKYYDCVLTNNLDGTTIAGKARILASSVPQPCTYQTTGGPVYVARSANSFQEAELICSSDDYDKKDIVRYAKYGDLEGYLNYSLMVLDEGVLLKSDRSLVASVTQLSKQKVILVLQMDRVNEVNATMLDILSFRALREQAKKSQ